MPQLLWSAGGVNFVDDFKILQLGSYNGIISLDWLEKHNPMVTHWEQGWLSIPYQGETVILHGDEATFHTTALLELQLMKEAAVVPKLPVPVEIR